MGEQIITIRNFIIRIIVLGTVFVLAVLVWSRVINQVTPDMASAMADSTFPLVSMNKDGTDFNCLHGYSREMDVSQIELGNFRRLAEIAPKVCDHYNVRQEWLMKGEGEIFRQKEEVSDQKSILSELKEIRTLLQKLVDLEKSTISESVKESNVETRQELLFDTSRVVV